MTGNLWWDQTVVGIFAVVCWVLAHQTASRPGAWARAIAMGYSLAGFAATASVIFHFYPSLYVAIPWAGSAAHTAVTATLMLVALRIARR